MSSASRTLGMLEAIPSEEFRRPPASDQMHLKAIMHTLKQAVLCEKKDELRSRRREEKFQNQNCANKIKRKYGIY